MEQQIKNLFNPPLLVISPEADDHNNCLGMIMLGNYNVQHYDPYKYKAVVGKASSGDMIGVSEFQDSNNLSKSTDKNYTESGYICDIINGKYLCFQSTVSGENVYDDCIYCDGAPACIIKKPDSGSKPNSTIWIYKQGNLPWCDSQKVGCDVINILEIIVEINDNVPIAYDILTGGLYNHMYICAVIESSISDDDEYPIKIDVKRLLETSVPTLTTLTPRVDKLRDDVCGTFSICTMKITIDDVTSSVEPDPIAARVNLRPDRPVWTTSRFWSLRSRYSESLYDAELLPRLTAQLRGLMIPVFAGLVTKYLTRIMPT